MKRRDWLRVTAAAAPAALAQQTPPPEAQPPDVSAPANRPAFPNAPASTARVFDEHRLKTVEVLSRLIIPRTDTPSAADAQVHVYLDRILADSPQKMRADFVEGLSWLDGYSLRAHELPFVRLREAQQVNILTKLNGKPDPALEPGQIFFRSLKQWVSRIYFATEAGLKELEKSAPSTRDFGCKHATHG